LLSRRRALQFAAAGAAAVLAGCAATRPRRSRDYEVVATGLRFPEGPVALADGAVLLVEIERRTLTRVDPDGSVDIVATLDGGPNGAAIGPDGACYVCNNGGENFAEIDGLLVPLGRSADYAGGWIERVDLASGRAEVLYRDAGGKPLSAPNDLVFDGTGGFWFTDIGKSGPDARMHGALYYVHTDSLMIDDVVPSLTTPNGVGLAPDSRILYVAELVSARLLAFDIVAPGQIAASDGLLPGRFVGVGPGRGYFDSLAIEAGGNICVASPLLGEIVVFAPDGEIVEIVTVPDPLPTNICFGGPDLRTAYVTLAGTGRLIAMDWPRPGLLLAYSA
jgi:gluconolactonase